MSTKLLNRPDVLGVLFHPREDFGLLRPDAHMVEIELDDEVDVGGRLYPAAPDAPVILYYHGNGEIAADYDDLSEFYVHLGITLLVMDYRGYGASGGHPTAENLVGDAMVVFNALDRVLSAHGLNPAQVYVMGRSLGSVPAIETALHAGDRLAGLIIESGFFDTFGLLARLGVRVARADEQQEGFGNAFKMEHITTRTLILHGADDFLIPPSDGQELHRRCAAADKHLVLIPGAGHNDIMITGMSDYFAAIRDFVLAKN
ncbi:MAG: alpha/beta hydrolase [Chloroflexaceae bacterium]|nr:alpha/beta hydrolase [Chloroflexaceae bacterium]